MQTSFSKQTPILQQPIILPTSHSLWAHPLKITYTSLVVVPNSLAQKINITYGFHKTQFGTCLIAIQDTAICYLAFCDDHQEAAALAELAGTWQQATLHENSQITQSIVDALFAPKPNTTPEIHLLLYGTPFQITVWQTLLQIPYGITVSYTDVAVALNMPRAVRAVASAIARNNISLLISCHRVISKSGNMHLYRWGFARKKAIIEWEQREIQK